LPSSLLFKLESLIRSRQIEAEDAVDQPQFARVHQGRLQSAVFFDPEFPKLDSATGVHVEEADRCSAGWCQAGDDSASQSEVIVPIASSWVEQFDDSAGLGINARQVRAFEGVAAITRQCEVFRAVVGEMLAGDDVLDMKRDKRRGGLRNPAVLAPVVSSMSDKFASLSVHVTRSCERGSGGLWTG